MREQVVQSTLGEVLRSGLMGQLGDGWVYLPDTKPLSVTTPCLIVADSDPETDEKGIALAAITQGFPVEGLDCATIEDVARCAQLFADPPPDDLLLESFVYYWRFDAFLPAPGAPDPPPPDELRGRLDRKFYDNLGAERANQFCREGGCARGAIEHSLFCRVHHFEMVRRRPCPFDD